MNWIIAHPDAATALATMALVVVGLVIGTGQIAVVWFGISRMTRAGEAREREQERRHKEAMDALAEERRQSEERVRTDREADERRHKQFMEAMEEGKRRHRQFMEAMEERERRHKEAMDALAEERRQSDERLRADREADERRHRQFMEAMEQHREAREQQKEAAEEGKRRHEEAMASLAAQRRALEALIERTAPPPAAPAE